MPSISHALCGSRGVVRMIAPALAAATLAACAQSSVATRKSEWPGGPRQAALAHEPASPPVPTVRAARVQEHETSTKRRAESRFTSRGLASFYSEGTETASGEKFDPALLTAAHPSLPFGTRLRVTNLTNGHSVTVRVNDRGPFVPGRVVDVSYSAARVLGMAQSGVANVRLEVVQ